MQNLLQTDEQILRILHAGKIDFDSVKYLLGLKNKDEIDLLYKKAYEIKKQYVGTNVYFRGIVEFSNICEKDCYYCGIRRGNKNFKRYQMTEDEAVNAAMWAFQNDFASIVIQAGERTDTKFISTIENIIKRVKDLSNGELGITLSLGEQTQEVYQKWYNAGAHRYLLRIESSNPELYKKLHPEDHLFESRINCIKSLKEIGYQTGSGVLIGVPGQTIDDLANDLFFLKELDVDMIGMGPYIVHTDTPMADLYENFESEKPHQLELALKMIALARIIMKDINIASTTALEALSNSGRELGLLAGANIIMPNITEVEFKSNYKLYENKPGVKENSLNSLKKLQSKIESLGETVGFGKWGDSPHFKNKKLKEKE